MLYLVLGALVGVYLLINYALGDIFRPFVEVYVAQPILWLALALLVLLLPRRKPSGSSSLRNPLIVVAAMVGVIHVILLVFAGFISGFGKSPYSSEALGIITNFFYVGSALVGMELSRAYVVNSLARKHSTLVIAFTALLFTGIAVHAASWSNIGGGEQSVSFLGGTVLPLLARSLLASFLAFLGGPLPALAYMGIVLAFQWFSPVLPDLSPTMNALFSTIAPIIGFVIVQYVLFPSYARVRSQRRERKASRSTLAGWVVTGIVSVVFIWFALGLFSTWPTVIYSGSMSPAIKVGDVAIVSEVSAKDIDIGDVVAFKRGEHTVIHRVVDIVSEEGKTRLITQGDANSIPDAEPLIPANVMGRVVFTVPDVGWAVVHVKDWLF